MHFEFGGWFRVLVVSWIVSNFAATASAQRELKDIPPPDPELERATFIVPDGFEVTLFAADPQLAKPIHMNFDADGRLWIASSEVYPHIKPGQPATDKILVIEDANHDGKADKTTVFADGLLIPTGVVPDINGAYVANSTELIYLADTDGDGKADRKQTVLSGFGTEDTHHLLHTLRWGPDGCLYMNQSIYIHSHIETPYGVKRLNGGGIWRFRPETLELEVLCYGFVNTWGHHFDRWGQSFATDGAYGEGINYVFPGSVFVTAPGAKRIMSGLNPGSPKHCALEIVSGRHMPPEWQGNMITNDFRAHRVCRFVVTDDASGYASRQEVEVIKSTHVAFRPIDVKMGPDGALYIADWYNPIIQHGEVDFRDPRRDHTHGRIWRVAAKDRGTSPHYKLTAASTAQLLDALKLPEDWLRLNAKLVLKTRDKNETLPALQSWVAALDKNDPEFEHHRLEALWLYESLDTVNATLLRDVLSSPDPRARSAAMRVVSHWRNRLDGATAVAEMEKGVRDEHPRVRLEAVRALSGGNSPDVAQIALTALDKPLDRNLDFALWQTARDLEKYWMPEVLAGRSTFGGRVDHLTFALKAIESPSVVQPLLNLIRENKVRPDQAGEVLTLIASLGGPKDLSVIFEAITDPRSQLSAATKVSMLNGLRDTSVKRKVQPEGNLSRVTALLDGSDDELRAAAGRVAGQWKVAEARRKIESWLVEPNGVAPAVRDAAFDALVAFGGDASVAIMKKLALPANSTDLRVRAITALTVLQPSEAAADAIELFVAPDAVETIAPIMHSLLAQKAGAGALASALASREVPADIAKRMLRATQSAPSPDPQLIAAIQKSGKLTDSGWKATPELLQQLVAEVMAKGNPERGEEIFRRKESQCSKCHSIGGVGGRVGPDLVSIGATAQIDYLILSLIKPNDKIKENYHSLVVETDDGKVVTGVPVRESKSELVLRDSDDNEISIPIGSIDERRDGRSLMPDGAADIFTRDELVDLVRFLSELGKVGKYAIGPQQVSRRWQVLTWSQEANFLLNRNSFDIAASERPEFVWQGAYSRVAGEFPLNDLPTFTPHKDLDPTTFVRCQIDVASAGNIPLKLNEQGLMLWVDGKPTPVTETLSFSKGRHTLTFAINRKQRTEPLRIELGDVAKDPAAGRAQFVLGK